MAHVFFFNDTATTEIYPLSLHDALPISRGWQHLSRHRPAQFRRSRPAAPDRDAVASRRVPEPPARAAPGPVRARSEEHTSELQSQSNLVCRLLLEKKK